MIFYVVHSVLDSTNRLRSEDWTWIDWIL